MFTAPNISSPESGERMNVMKSIHNFGAIMTRMALGGGQDPWGLAQHPEGSAKQEAEVDHGVMETKLKIIEILEFIMNVRLDYRISSLLTIFKRDFDESNAGLGDVHGENGIRILFFFFVLYVLSCFVYLFVVMMRRPDLVLNPFGVLFTSKPLHFENPKNHSFFSVETKSRFCRIVKLILIPVN